MRTEHGIHSIDDAPTWHDENEGAVWFRCLCGSHERIGFQYWPGDRTPVMLAGESLHLDYDDQLRIVTEMVEEDLALTKGAP